MAYQILDLEGTVIKTVETDELLQVEFDNTDINLFWDDEGLVESLKANHEDTTNIHIVKRVVE